MGLRKAEAQLGHIKMESWGKFNWDYLCSSVFFFLVFLVPSFMDEHHKKTRLSLEPAANIKAEL